MKVIEKHTPGRVPTTLRDLSLGDVFVVTSTLHVPDPGSPRLLIQPEMRDEQDNRARYIRLMGGDSLFEQGKTFTLPLDTPVRRLRATLVLEDE